MLTIDPRGCPVCESAHDDGCPIGRAGAWLADDDQRWFADHPDQTHRWRKVQPGDLGVSSFDGVEIGDEMLVVMTPGRFILRMLFDEIRVAPDGWPPTADQDFLLTMLSDGVSR